MAAGRVPVRKPENDLKGRHRHRRALRLDGLPALRCAAAGFNPAGSGTIVSANQKITPCRVSAPHHLRMAGAVPRALRRGAAARGAQAVGRDPCAHADGRRVARRARAPPHLLSTRPKDAAGREALKMLAAWDGGMAADRAEPLIVTAWWRELAFALYADELGGDFRPNWSTSGAFVRGVLKGHGAWCDDVARHASKPARKSFPSRSTGRCGTCAGASAKIRSPGKGAAHLARTATVRSRAAPCWRRSSISPWRARRCIRSTSDAATSATTRALTPVATAGYRAIYDWPIR